MAHVREIVARLRAPDGCPWDREQTHTSLRGSVLEEAHEVVEAINSGDVASLREELGDLLLQVLMHSQLAEEAGAFSFDDVARALAEKLIRRHPHVFGADQLPDTGAVLKRWDEIKRAEKGDAPASALAGVSKELPALMRAEKVQKKAARVGFDWPDAAPVLAKVREELAELEREIGESSDKMEEEIGDLLFAVVNLARKLHLDSEVALQRATGKFIRRFEQLESIAAARSLSLESLTLAELDGLWDEVKAARVSS